MRVAVNYQDEHLDFEIDDDRLIGHWSGPSAEPEGEAAELFRRAIESPTDFPPLAHAVVPGDRVVVPLDPSTPSSKLLLETLASALRSAEVEGITVVSTAPEPPELPESVSWRIHDPDDRSQIAYLSSTKDGRRVYLNKHLTDGDIVIPVGTLGYDGTLGYRGPWSVIYPGLSDRETLSRFQGLLADGVPDIDTPSSSLLESAEVGWLLGCQFQIGVLPGRQGVAKVVAGLEPVVRAEGARTLDQAWTFQVNERADVVLAGIGSPGRSTTLGDLAQGLDTARRLVRRGGKIVALSRAEGEIGPALRRNQRRREPEVGDQPAQGSGRRSGLPDRSTNRRGDRLGRRLSLQPPGFRDSRGDVDDPSRPTRGSPQTRILCPLVHPPQPGRPDSGLGD